ncbi:copper amine oxidase N-terminal domain-containing protein [Desulfallas sp. Bu1-1]|uniref:copper amine oxidase N-terminal domain-containing protein n=1 Tax=Desulfallas sp. Bu1-1 TaxID=2787620 RepID=UPI0018A07648|nr:copper amine oxidase N-terminal domain-containing protein [Desulfallas sp. Bu1-1]MBF7081560.1 copper amine oxidase N-terminal domain-containing protein [Desulfallas sp. Bu1-1]
MNVFKKWTLIMIFLVGYPGIALANPQANSVEMKLGDTNYYVDGQAHEMQIAPTVHEGVTMVPLRVISEIFGGTVSWEQYTGIVNLKMNEKQSIQIDTHNNIAYINGTSSTTDIVTLIQDGTTMVPLRFLAQNLNYQVNYNTNTKEIQIKKLPPPNQRPVALFKLPKDTYAQGETIAYEDESYDPDGDAIIERKWEGRENAYFKQGEYKVSLTVKDSNGAWSEPYSQIIKITDQVEMDQLAYYFNHPVLGKALDVSHLPVLEMKILSRVVTMKKESVIISNCPETFTRDGVLYRDEVTGNNRILYHHLNGANQPKSVYLLAINNGSRPATLWVKRQGMAGPSNPMDVGRLAAYNFLGFDQSDSYSLELQPGEKIILNKDANNPIKPGQTVHGIFDVSSDSYLTFAIVAVGKQDPINDYEQLPVLPRDQTHTRGTFQLPSRNMTVKIPDFNQQPSRIVIADGKDDAFLYGKDVTSGQNVLYTRNPGNYGVVYSITIESQQRVALLLNPRGGVFAGAGSWDGKPFYIPDSGILQPKTEAALLGILEPGKRKVLQFIPPAGSYLPVNIICIPF